MDWGLIGIIIALFAAISIVVYAKASSGIRITEKAWSSLPGCGRRLLRELKRKLGGC